VVRGLGRAAAPLEGQVLPLLADPLVRGEAARALGELGARPALPHLLQWLQSPDAELRTAAAMALGPLGDRSAVPPLQQRLDDAKEAMDVRVAAAFSLALFENDRPARRFLLERKQKVDYHAPTIDELLDRVERGR
jgi:HEAT repeat protein